MNMRKGRGNAALITIVLVAAVIISYNFAGDTTDGQQGTATNAATDAVVQPTGSNAATEQASPSPAQPPSATAPPSESEYVPEEVTLFLPNDNADGFIKKTEVSDGSADVIVKLLVENGALIEGCELLSFSEENAVIDMNAVFGKQLGNGTTGEYLCAGALINTILTYYGMDEIMLTVEGKMPENAHGVYDKPLGFYE
jgi:hypothetical protein